jgi:3-hydroxyisobutyrate dehydrogenase-like beta-hydroxyacid dehydrogenase
MAEFSLGVLGLGPMGGPIAKRLARQGLAPQVADPNPQTIQYYVAEGGANPAATPLHLAQQSQVLVIVLPDERSLRDAVTGTNGIIHGLRPGTLIIDMSGAEPETGAALARGIASRGAVWIEAALAGTPKDAAAGTLDILVGGRDEPVERALPVLEALAKRIVRTGPLGSAALVKSLGGLLAGLNLLAAAEALIVGKRFGLQPAEALDALCLVMPAGSALPPALAEQVLTRRFQSGSSLTGLLRDIDRVQSAARSTGTPAPLAAAAREICAAAKLNLEASDDYTQVVRWLERVAKAELDGRTET